MIRLLLSLLFRVYPQKLPTTLWIMWITSVDASTKRSLIHRGTVDLSVDNVYKSADNLNNDTPLLITL